jgi:hypothetical protein
MSEEEREAVGLITIGPKTCPHCGAKVWIRTAGTETQMEGLGEYDLIKQENPYEEKPSP